MLCAVIIDDEPNGVKSLELLIKKFVPQLRVIGSTTNPATGVELINDLQPEIVFLDINMPVLNGFELLEKITYRHFYLVFTTAYSEYALKALKQNATDYLLKPIGEVYIKEAVERVQLKIAEKQQVPDVQKLLNDLTKLKHHKVLLPTKTSIDFVASSDIIYIEAKANISRVATSGMNIIEVNKPLKEYELLLCREELKFIRIHNSFIINIDHMVRYIKENGGYVVMLNNKNIPISKQKKESLLRMINFEGIGFKL